MNQIQLEKIADDVVNSFNYLKSGGTLKELEDIEYLSDYYKLKLSNVYVDKDGNLFIN